VVLNAGSWSDSCGEKVTWEGGDSWEGGGRRGRRRKVGILERRLGGGESGGERKWGGPGRREGLGS
jgi:hypothetical protein